MKYRTKLEVIEAEKISIPYNAFSVTVFGVTFAVYDQGMFHRYIVIPTGGAAIHAKVDDWLIRDKKGNFKVLSNTEFTATYEPHFEASTINPFSDNCAQWKEGKIEDAGEREGTGLDPVEDYSKPGDIWTGVGWMDPKVFSKLPSTGTLMNNQDGTYDWVYDRDIPDEFGAKVETIHFKDRKELEDWVNLSPNDFATYEKLNKAKRVVAATFEEMLKGLVEHYKK